MLLPADLVDHLVRLGLDRELAESFVKLAVMGTADPVSFARAAGMTLPASEAALARLAGAGLAERIGGTTYVPVPAEEIPQRLGLARAQARVRILRGRIEGEAVAAEMMSRARRDFRFVNTFPMAAEVAKLTRVFETGLKRASEGLHIWGAIQSTPSSRALIAPVLRHPNVHLVHIETERPIRVWVVDEKEVVAALATDDSSRPDASGDLAVWTAEPDFVAAQLALVDAHTRAGIDLRDLLRDDPKG